jgi:hypothetical protein
MSSHSTAIATDPARALHHTINALQHEDRFPLSVVPHLILFFSGEKDAVRLVLRDHTLKQLHHELDGMGYASADTPIDIRPIGAHWGQVESTKASKAARLSPTTHSVLVLSRNQSDALRILDEELSGESMDSGRRLGYPECCVAAYPGLASRASDWPMALLSRASVPWSVSMWCNRLASLWGGACPTGELYPCNLECPAAIQLGKRADFLLRQHGFAEIAEEICRQASRPLYLLDDEIVVGDIGQRKAQEIVIHG